MSLYRGSTRVLEELLRVVGNSSKAGVFEGKVVDNVVAAQIKTFKNWQKLKRRMLSHSINKNR